MALFFGVYSRSGWFPERKPGGARSIRRASAVAPECDKHPSAFVVGVAVDIGIGIDRDPDPNPDGPQADRFFVCDI
jgi:hypothetical protein